jgi:hypothetical protein
MSFFADIASKEQRSSLISLKLKILNWVPPTPSPASECVSPLGPKGGWGSNALLHLRGSGGPNSVDCVLCAGSRHL